MRNWEKLSISKAVVAEVRSNGGYFLKHSSLTGMWHDVGDEKALEKTSQALRENQQEWKANLQNEDLKKIQRDDPVDTKFIELMMLTRSDNLLKNRKKTKMKLREVKSLESRNLTDQRKPNFAQNPPYNCDSSVPSHHDHLNTTDSIYAEFSSIGPRSHEENGNLIRKNKNLGATYYHTFLSNNKFLQENTFKTWNNEFKQFKYQNILEHQRIGSLGHGHGRRIFSHSRYLRRRPCALGTNLFRL
eukprot:CAMPEP_0184866198 /NCGR_PEP_ID=MMETSP0580-20130426/21271_1 /TAXON_ID=1118495 /ORGANISM="Dactyliosolen fragilissimus" /LENGTH=244 /DNA_ID=CAMNT_0027365733 /DNA_START=215 /DNA_END=949 /DNA_ORIENTATION=+